MIQKYLHDQICKNKSKVEEWYLNQAKGLSFPIYSSFDIRDSGMKVTPVDANIFPAGFNNICDVDKENAPVIFKQYLQEKYPELRQLVVLAEEHTANTYYWENVYTIKNLIESAGYQVRVAIPRDLEEPLTVTSAHGHSLIVFGSKKVGNKIQVDGVEPELIINNNDFSNDYSEWADQLEIPVNPHFKMGWYWRRKEAFFRNYNQLVQDFAHLIEVPAIVLQIKTESYRGFDINLEASRLDLAHKVDLFIETLAEDYKKADISVKPFVFVKNSSGTYGLGVTKVESGDEIRNWNYKLRKKMKAAKGGGGFDEVIIQEGIPTKYVGDYGTAEPAIYMVGQKLCGGFLRSHSQKGPSDSLNSPGAVYKRLCISDLKVDTSKCPMENVYGWAAKIGMLAIAREFYEAKLI